MWDYQLLLQGIINFYCVHVIYYVPHVLDGRPVLDQSYMLLNNIIYTFLYSCHMSNVIKIHQLVQEILTEFHIEASI